MAFFTTEAQKSNDNETTNSSNDAQENNETNLDNDANDVPRLNLATKGLDKFTDKQLAEAFAAIPRK